MDQSGMRHAPEEGTSADSADHISSYATKPPVVDALIGKSGGHAADYDGIVEDRRLPGSTRKAVRDLLKETSYLRNALSDAYRRMADLENLADLDSLVPALNRRAFMRQLQRTISFGIRYNTENSVMYFDINGMKSINDNLGHGAGDAALKKITETIHENIRTSDVAGRLGGDEFAVILVQTNNATALIKARQLEEAVAANPLIWEQQAISLETAVGVHTIQEGDTALSALDTADRAMYVHKITRKGDQPPR